MQNHLHHDTKWFYAPTIKQGTGSTDALTVIKPGPVKSLVLIMLSNTDVICTLDVKVTIKRPLPPNAKDWHHDFNIPINIPPGSVFERELWLDANEELLLIGHAATFNWRTEQHELRDR